MTHNTVKCERCNESIQSKKAKWLELSLTDGFYYHNLPASHESQGAFSFGIQCASMELNKTIEYLKGKML